MWPDESVPPSLVGEGNIALLFVIGVTPDALPKAEYIGSDGPKFR